MIDELLALQDRWGREHRAERIKWLAILIGGLVISVLSRLVSIGILNLPFLIWFAFAPFGVLIVVVLWILRAIRLAKFTSVLRGDPKQITSLHTRINFNAIEGQGTVFEISTMDGRKGAATFQGAEVERAKAILQQLCPNLRIEAY